MNAPEFSDQEMALEVAASCGGDWRFVADTGQWLHWNGTFWEIDRRYAVAAPIAAICCQDAERAIQAYEGKEGQRLARSLASDKTNRAVLSRFSRDQRIVVTHDQLDRDQNLLGTLSGFIDLETGKSYPPDRGKLITMSTSVEPAPPGTRCDLYMRFLASTYPWQARDGAVVPQKRDREVIAYLQRYGGYSLTGLVREHTCVFLLGSGGNGKGVLTHTWQDIAGDYATVINAESLMERFFERHRSEYAVLRGKRLIFCREVSPGKYWDYGKLMGFVGGDPIEANYMRQNPFTFRPCGKLTIESNNRPAFRVITPAVERRLALVRHRVRFMSKEKLAKLLQQHPELQNDPTIVEADLNLEKQLKPEHPAILRWMISGAVAYFRKGLQTPDSILTDSNEYLQDQDDMGAWIRECCLTVIGDGGRRKDLYESFTLWSAERGQKPITYREFGNILRDIHGFQIVHQSYGDQVVGLALNDFARTKLQRHRDQNTTESKHADEWP